MVPVTPAALSARSGDGRDVNSAPVSMLTTVTQPGGTWAGAAACAWSKSDGWNHTAACRLRLLRRSLHPDRQALVGGKPGRIAEPGVSLEAGDDFPYDRHRLIAAPYLYFNLLPHLIMHL